ncbi:MAG: hypothetical protein Q7S31_02690 [bacterium]|nr:hypothetical protein [bacterium]
MADEIASTHPEFLAYKRLEKELARRSATGEESEELERLRLKVSNKAEKIGRDLGLPGANALTDPAAAELIRQEQKIITNGGKRPPGERIQ